MENICQKLFFSKMHGLDQFTCGSGQIGSKLTLDRFMVIVYFILWNHNDWNPHRTINSVKAWLKLCGPSPWSDQVVLEGYRSTRLTSDLYFVSTLIKLIKLKGYYYILYSFEFHVAYELSFNAMSLKFLLLFLLLDSISINS